MTFIEVCLPHNYQISGALLQDLAPRWFTAGNLLLCKRVFNCLGHIKPRIITQDFYYRGNMVLASFLPLPQQSINNSGLITSSAPRQAKRCWRRDFTWWRRHAGLWLCAEVWWRFSGSLCVYVHSLWPTLRLEITINRLVWSQHSWSHWV